ncbi:MAG: GNAT family N-acetyltransferase [Chloroflexaceae bacterium]|jgi:GNAT superfamily N-acetyltransferase|nr:GNAT family N-acetyltransferase [Chloroflexaceae bacterium]
MITIVNTQHKHIPQLVQHQQTCFPDLFSDVWMTPEAFESQLRVFPAGQHVALHNGQVVGQSSSFRCRYEQVFLPHDYHGITAANMFTNHDPVGEWLYGADMSIHPEYRGRGIAHMLMEARKGLIRQLGLRGMVAGGALPGYADYEARLRPEDYVAEVVAGRLVDPTLTPQLRIGWQVRGVLPNYTHDSAGHGAPASWLVWEA